MADEKNVTLEQFKGFMTKADERLDKLEVGKENKVSPVSITIPTEGWASEEIGETDEEGTEGILSLLLRHRGGGRDRKAPGGRDDQPRKPGCGDGVRPVPTSETTEGKIRLRAMKAPTEAITAEYWLRSGKE